MSIKQLVVVAVCGLLAMSSVAVADGTANEPQRMWTLQAAEKHAEHAQSKKTVTDPGVLVSSQRDPHGTK